MGLAAPNEEAYLQQLLRVQQQDRLAAMALADAPALPQLQWEDDVPQAEAEQTEAEALCCTVPPSAPVDTQVAAAMAAVSNDGGLHLQLISMMPTGAYHHTAVNHAAVPAASSYHNSKQAGQEPPVPFEGQQRTTRRASNRRYSSRSDVSGSASLGASSSGRSETAARIRYHAAVASKSNASSEALEPPTPDQVQNHTTLLRLSRQWLWLSLGSSNLSSMHSIRIVAEVNAGHGVHID